MMLRSNRDELMTTARDSRMALVAWPAIALLSPSSVIILSAFSVLLTQEHVVLVPETIQPRQHACSLELTPFPFLLLASLVEPLFSTYSTERVFDLISLSLLLAHSSSLAYLFCGISFPGRLPQESPRVAFLQGHGGHDPEESRHVQVCLLSQILPVVTTTVDDTPGADHTADNHRHDP